MEVDATTATPPAANPSGFARLWSRYKRARGARLGLVLVVFFTLTAFLAPFLAHRLPIYWIDYDETGAARSSWPLIREFFAPADTTEPMLERSINFIFLFIPVALVAWKGMNAYLPGLRRRESRGISLVFGALFAGVLWLAIGGMVVDAGGRDWLYSEEPPVPDVDDLAETQAFWRRVEGGVHSNPDDQPPLVIHSDDLPPEPLRSQTNYTPAQQAAWEAVQVKLGPILLAAGGVLPSPDSPDAGRIIAMYLQRLIDAPPILPVATGRAKGITSHGLDDEALATGINTARWNRMVVETAFPGLLTPMRRVRDSFLGMAVLSVLVLIGLSYICLAGAWQFTLDPRWLVLLALACLLTLPFRLPVRHNHLPYRSLAAEGKGWGIFPPIPYGPNENGFGPRLPPDWWVESPTLTEASVRSWQSLAAPLEHPETGAAAALLSLLEKHFGGRPPIHDRAAMLEALNALLDEPELTRTIATPEFRGDVSTNPFLAAIRAGRELRPLERRRLNRLLVERTLPGAFLPAPANHWKKPRDMDGRHLLGTDESGRDVLVRIIHGARVSLSVGFVSVFLATVLGLVFGSLVGYYGGKVDLIGSRFMEIMMCFPSFFLILAVIAVLDRRSIVNIMLVIGLTSWTGVARLIRGEMLRHKRMDYVSASIALGASDTRTIFRHILPNAMAPVLVSISFGITGAILTEASLSFIGFGVTPPTPTWGQLLSETRESPLANWWLAVFPGIVLFVSVLAYNMVGEAMRDALDPRTTV